ncbi:PaaD-like zinc ribbon domain-containing protein [Natrarchaeobius chitinivorans]|uniref:PaaD-like zinc ribbon domain-containing protein n=1 Tax=Natrarchaeobius chitinivorans TaxID=1679083 RepID=UPI0014052D76|nr:hypothetical protein [Natrarchaeobius chitinivorans]
MSFDRNRGRTGDETGDKTVRCPYCGSDECVLERERGPGLCRTVHYCTDCEQPFEEFG